MSKILKNTTGSTIDLDVIGISIAASSQVTINEEDYLLLASSESITELTTPIGSGDIVVNDGSSDLSATIGLAYIKYPDEGLRTLHDPTGTDLTSTTISDAISELADKNGPKDFDYIEKTTTVTTTGSSFTVYETLNFNVSDTSGTNTYRFNADFLWGHDSASNDIRVRVTLDGSPIKEIRIEPKDTGNDQRFQNNILIYAEDLSSGAHTFVLEFRPASSSRISRMYEAILEGWRTE